ncbi:MAG: hypothetical protein AAGC74_12705 [Verrucomicrobiota bacterium]
MNEQVYNSGTIELTASPHTGRRTIVGVFAINSETNDFRYQLKEYSLNDIPDLDETTFGSLKTTLSNWLANLKDRSNTPIETLTTPRGGLIQFVARGSFLISPENPTWFENIATEYLTPSPLLA